MRKLIASEFMSLDGVGQAPGGKDEDPSGGFVHGGWHMPFMDEIGGKWVNEALGRAGGLLLGRRTYEIFAGYWPNASEEQQDVAGPLNALPKFVASETLSEPLAWRNSSLLRGPVPEAVRALKREEGGDLLVFGSLAFLQTLIAHEQVDEYRLMIDPLVLGGGKRIFHEDAQLRRLRLVESQVTTTGALVTTYAPHTSLNVSFSPLLDVDEGRLHASRSAPSIQSPD